MKKLLLLRKCAFLCVFLIPITVNLMGQEVGPFYKGIVIEMYSDGTSQKFYK